MNVSTNSFGNFLGVRRNKFGLGSFLLCMLFGLAFGGAGLFLANANSIDPHWTRINGVVTSAGANNASNGHITYAPTISYTVSGVTYKVTSNVSSSAYPAMGSAKQIAYNPNNPEEAKVVETGILIFMTMIFGGVGVLILVLAPVMFIRSLVRGHDIAGLKRTGQKIQGVITDLQDDGQNSKGYRLVVSATDPSGVVRNFVSDTATSIGALAMSDFRKQPIAIDVYINPNKPSDYYVDISEVPSLTPERITELLSRAGVDKGPTSVVAGPEPLSAPPSTPPE